jgi:hypothetical protein
MSLRPGLKFMGGIIRVDAEYHIRGADTQSRLPRAMPAAASVPPFDGYYRGAPMSDPVGRHNAGSWKKLWLTIDMPSGQVLPRSVIWAGARDLPFGAGATLPHNLSRDILALSFPVHRFKITVGTGASLPTNVPTSHLRKPLPYGPAALVGMAGAYTVAAGACLFVRMLATGPDDTSGQVSRQNGIFSDRYAGITSPGASAGRSHALTNVWPDIFYDDVVRYYSDVMGDRQPFNILLVRYDEAKWTGGIGIISYPKLKKLGTTELGNTLPRATAGDAQADSAATWLTYFTYNDGRVFGSVEYASLGWNVFSSDADARHKQGFHMFTEAGGLVGPAKVSVMFAAASGPRHDDRGLAPAAIPFPVYAQALEPYESLTFRQFGGGNQTFIGTPYDRQGMMSDAYALGARAEVALAANISIRSSILWARRLEETGTLFGQYLADGSPAGDEQRLIFARKMGRPVGSVTDIGYVSAMSLGHEINLGIQWRFADGYNLGARWAVRQRGDWFREAYQNIRPGSLSPDHGVFLSLTTEF